MRVLVTGSTGLVGSRLCPRLAARGHQVVAASRRGRAAAGARAPVAFDLAGPGVREAVLASEAEVVIHAASMADVDACELDPARAWAVNASGTAELAAAARSLGAHLVYVSTDYVFDGSAGPYGEADVPSPRGAYALSKHAGELATRALAPDWTIARTAVVFGWPPAERPNFGSWLVGALERGERVRLFHDQLVSPSLADSVADMLVELAERRLGGVFHTCGGEVVDRVAFGRALCDELGLDPGLIEPVSLAEARLPAPRPLRAGLTAGRARAELAARPLALRDALRAFRDQRRGAA